VKNARPYAKHTKIKAGRRLSEVRKTLRNQGVTAPSDVRVHEDFLMKTLRVNPAFPLDSYRLTTSLQVRMD